ncbi:MAG: PHP domain-containing protein [Peptostreptococcaceae bacterium]|nr:PHP domain-containing protein [Peptostreptococcaceae bacterium]
MRLDMHCHCKHGSIDSKITVLDYAEKLKTSGFDGMLVTDHDSYRAYNKFKKTNPDGIEGFKIFMGVEYDTIDAGHFIVIMPEGLQIKALELRGMLLNTLIKTVHSNGGILGPAHPFGVRSSSAMFFRKLKRNPDLILNFDFIEGFNTCENPISNKLAKNLAKEYDKPCTGGSDAHKSKYVSTAYTEFNSSLIDNDDLIKAIKNNEISGFGGVERETTMSSKQMNAFYAVFGFLAYNKSLSLLYSPLRMISLSNI